MSDSESDSNNQDALTEKILALEERRNAYVQQREKTVKMVKLEKMKDETLRKRKRSRSRKTVENPVPALVANDPMIRLAMVIFQSQYITSYGERKIEGTIPWSRFQTWPLVMLRFLISL